MQIVDTIIQAEWIIPVEPGENTLENHSIVVDQGNIIDVPANDAIAERYQARQTVNLKDQAVIPGFVNAHTHAAMTLMRGFADDIPLMEWLQNHIWPTEAVHVNEDYVADGTELAIAEMIRSGTTCMNDMYFYPDVVARKAHQTGMRLSAGLIVLDFPTAWAQNADEYIEKATRVYDECRLMPLVSTAFAPHAPYTVSDEPLERVRVLADQLDIPIHIHVHETAHEVAEAQAQFGFRPLERLSRLGLLSPRLIAVHMTQLLAGEIETLAEKGVNVIHCPESNLKLASGFCQVGELLKAGVNVALGTDGAAANNDLDMLAEMRMASFLAKGVSADATTLAAIESLRMATLNGAKALGLDKEIGSIKAGKQADLVAIDLSSIECRPIYDPVSQIVYSSTREQISNVWIAGQQVLSNRQLTRIDTDDLQRRVGFWQQRLDGSLS